MRASNRLLVAGALLLVAVMAVAGAAVVLQSLRRPSGSATSACSPSPCVAPHGLELHVDAITRAGSDVVLRVHFVNHTTGGGFEATSVRHTGLADFSLRAGGVTAAPDITSPPPECARWPDVEVARGATSAARTVCFRVAAGTPMTLTWSPDLGLVFRSVDLALGSAP